MPPSHTYSESLAVQRGPLEHKQYARHYIACTYTHAGLRPLSAAESGINTC